MCSCCGQFNPKKFWQSIEVVYYCGINDLHFGADVEVPNADPEAVSPLVMPGLNEEGRRHETIDYYLCILTKPIIISRILFQFYFG